MERFSKTTGKGDQRRKLSAWLDRGEIYIREQVGVRSRADTQTVALSREELAKIMSLTPTIVETAGPIGGIGLV